MQLTTCKSNQSIPQQIKVSKAHRQISSTKVLIRVNAAVEEVEVPTEAAMVEEGVGVKGHPIAWYVAKMLVISPRTANTAKWRKN